MKKILYVGNFTNDYNSEEYIAKSFEQLGHFVQRLNESEVNVKDIFREVKRKEYDFLLYAKLRIGGDVRTLLKEIKIPTVCWFFDNFMGTPREKTWLKRPWINMCDYLFTTDGGHQKEFKEAGLNHQCVRQGIFHEEAYMSDANDSPKIDVLFVGNYEHVKTRKALIDFLRKSYGKGFKLMGHNKKSIVRQDKLNDLYASTKVVVGDNTYETKGYWSNRVYETLGRGGFLITIYVDGLEKEFIDWKHLVYYKDRDFQDLKSKIDFFLRHGEKIDKIRKAGFEYCKNNYTYKYRCQELLKKLYGKNNNRLRKR